MLWVGDVISALGDYSFGITLTIWVGFILGYGQVWAPLAVIVLVLTTAIPPMIIGPIAGVYVDRWNKRRTMIIVDILQFALVFVLVLTTFAPGGHLPIPWELGLIFVVNFLLVSVDQFYNQAGFPLIIDLVGGPQIPKAISRILVFVSIGTILGPAIGAPLIIQYGPRWALLINALSFIVSMASIIAIKAPHIAHESQPQEKKRFWPEFISGARFLFGSIFLRIMLIALVIETLGSSMLNGLNVFFATNNLHIANISFLWFKNLGALGLIGTVAGLGMLAGSAISSKIVERYGEDKVFWMSLIAGGLLILIYARLTTFLPALIVIFAMGIPTGTVNVALGPMIARSTPREMMGRSNAARVSIVSIAGFVGAALAGTLDTTLFRGFHAQALGIQFGPLDTIFTIGGALAVVGGLFAMRYLTSSKKPEVPAPVSSVSAATSEE